MIKEINRITKETRNLLIVASIGVLAGLTLLIFNNQEKVSTLIEQEQKIEYRGLPSAAPIELLGEISMVSDEDLKNFFEKELREKFCTGTAMELICPGLLKWLDAKAE